MLDWFIKRRIDADRLGQFAETIGCTHEEAVALSVEAYKICNPLLRVLTQRREFEDDLTMRMRAVLGS